MEVYVGRHCWGGSESLQGYSPTSVAQSWPISIYVDTEFSLINQTLLLVSCSRLQAMTAKESVAILFIFLTPKLVF